MSNKIKLEHLKNKSNSQDRVHKSILKSSKLNKFSKMPNLKLPKLKKPLTSSIQNNWLLLKPWTNLLNKSLLWVSQLCIWDLQAVKIQSKDGKVCEEWSQILHLLSTFWKILVKKSIKLLESKSKLCNKEWITKNLSLSVWSKFQNLHIICYFGFKRWLNCIMSLNKLSLYKRRWRKWRKKQIKWRLILNRQNN